MLNVSYYSIHCKYCGVLIKQTQDKHEISKEHICRACNQTNVKPSWQIYQDALQERV